MTKINFHCYTINSFTSRRQNGSAIVPQSKLINISLLIIIFKIWKPNHFADFTMTGMQKLKNIN